MAARCTPAGKPHDGRSPFFVDRDRQTLSAPDREGAMETQWRIFVKEFPLRGGGRLAPGSASSLSGSRECRRVHP